MMRFEKPMRPLFIAFIAILLTLPAGPAVAEDAPLTQRPEVRQFLSRMVERHQFQPGELEQLFKQASRQQKIIDAISRPAEGKPWHQYRPIFITEKRIRGGVEFRKRHAGSLRRAEEIYGVPGEMITAILGVETYYGRHKGSYRVLDALTTLGFDYPKRGKFFRSELEQFLLLTREEEMDPLSIKGSYAGAMGYPQFISSSFRHYAVDFDGDRRRDIWNNVDDAIGSIANYFSRHGWQRGQSVVFPAHVTGNAHAAYIKKGLKPHTPIGEFRKKGISINARLPATEKGALIELRGPSETEYWVGLNNFYVITRYNHSPLYAMAVYQLSEEIRRQGSLETARLTRDQTR